MNALYHYCFSKNPSKEFWAIFIALISAHLIISGFCCDSVGLLLGSGVLALLCPGSLAATRSHPPFLVGFGLLPGPKWLRACCGWGDPGVAWSRVLG